MTTIFDHIPTKRYPYPGDLIEGYARDIDGQLTWCEKFETGWRLVYGCVTDAADPMQVHTWSGLVTVHGKFIAKVVRDNEAYVKHRGECRIWVPMPLGTNRKGELVNPPKSGYSVLIADHLHKPSQ